MTRTPGVSPAPGQEAKPRRASRFWAPLNNWWRQFLAERGRRPTSSDVSAWFTENAEAAWGAGKPQWKEARVHAKCLRSTEQVRNYFREYRMRSRFGNADGGPSSSMAGGAGASDMGVSSGSAAGTGSSMLSEQKPLDERRGTASLSILVPGSSGRYPAASSLPRVASLGGGGGGGAGGSGAGVGLPRLPSAGSGGCSGGAAGEVDNLGMLIAVHNARIARINSLGSNRSASPSPTSLPVRQEAFTPTSSSANADLPNAFLVPADLGADASCPSALSPDTPTPIFSLLNPSTVTTGGGMPASLPAPKAANTERLSRFHSQRFSAKENAASPPNWDRSVSFGAGPYPPQRPSVHTLMQHGSQPLPDFASFQGHDAHEAPALSGALEDSSMQDAPCATPSIGADFSGSPWLAHGLLLGSQLQSQSGGSHVTSSKGHKQPRSQGSAQQQQQQQQHESAAAGMMLGIKIEPQAMDMHQSHVPSGIPTPSPNAHLQFSRARQYSSGSAPATPAAGMVPATALRLHGAMHPGLLPSPGSAGVSLTITSPPPFVAAVSPTSPETQPGARGSSTGGQYATLQDLRRASGTGTAVGCVEAGRAGTQRQGGRRSDSYQQAAPALIESRPNPFAASAPLWSAPASRASAVETRHMVTGSNKGLAELWALADRDYHDESMRAEEAEETAEEGGDAGLRYHLGYPSSASLPEGMLESRAGRQSGGSRQALQTQAMVAGLRRASFPMSAHAPALARTVSAAGTGGTSGTETYTSQQPGAGTQQLSGSFHHPHGPSQHRFSPFHHMQQQQQQQQQQQVGEAARGVLHPDLATRSSFQMAVYEQHLQQQQQQQQPWSPAARPPRFPSLRHTSSQGAGSLLQQELSASGRRFEETGQGQAPQHLQQAGQAQLLQQQQRQQFEQAHHDNDALSRQGSDPLALLTLQNLRVRSGRRDSMAGMQGQPWPEEAHGDEMEW